MTWVWIHSLFYSLTLWCINISICQFPQIYGPKKLHHSSDEEYKIFLLSYTYKTWIYFVVNLNGAYPKLVPFRPAGRLISPPLLLSVILNILLSLAMHIVGFILVQRQPWYSMGMHRYDHSLRLSHSNFCQTSSGPYVGRQMGLHSTNALASLRPLAVFQWSLLCSTVWWHHSLALIFAHLEW